MLGLSANRMVVSITLLWGVWGLCNACFTNTEECIKIRERSSLLPTAQQQCEGMRAFRRCVDEDVADCPSTNPLYPNNGEAVMTERSYCSHTYICGWSIHQCYKNLTTRTLDRITLSKDDDQRAQMCRTLEQSIHACQEQVMRNCSEEVGILETVSKPRQQLTQACGNNLICMTKVMECQKLSHVMIKPQNPEDCFNEGYSDHCGRYERAMQCLRHNLTACEKENYSLEGVRDAMAKTTEDVCNLEEMCRAKLEACSCHVDKITTAPPSSWGTICQTFSSFVGCLSRVEGQCVSSINATTKAAAMRSTYRAHYNLLCTEEKGLCPEAVQCLSYLPAELDSPRELQTSAYSELGVQRLCRHGVIDPMLECLRNASDTCNGETGVVSFPTVKDNYLQTCADLLPQADSLNQCSSFQQCVRGLDLGIQSVQKELDKIQKIYIGLTKTEFWCRLLTHSLKCVTQTNQNCSLDPTFIQKSSQRYKDVKALCGIADVEATDITQPAADKPDVYNVIERVEEDNKDKGDLSKDKTKEAGGAGSNTISMGLVMTAVTLLLMTQQLNRH